MASMGVPYVVPRITLMASLCTLSSFSRLDCNRVLRPKPLLDTDAADCGH